MTVAVDGQTTVGAGVTIGVVTTGVVTIGVVYVGTTTGDETTTAELNLNNFSAKCE